MSHFYHSHSPEFLARILKPFTKDAPFRVCSPLKPLDHDLKADLSDIDEFDLALSPEGFNLLRESRL